MEQQLSQLSPEQRQAVLVQAQQEGMINFTHDLLEEEACDKHIIAKRYSHNFVVAVVDFYLCWNI